MAEVVFKCKGREKEYQNEWQKSHRDDNKREWEKNHRQKNKTKINKQKRESARICLQKLKDKIFILLGNECSNPNCPIPKELMDKRCLQIDHINNDGAKERKKCPNGTIYYYKKVLVSLRKGEKKYQLLCAYCNWLKRYKDLGED
jgi:hypothetical protein